MMSPVLYIIVNEIAPGKKSFGFLHNILLYHELYLKVSVLVSAEHSISGEMEAMRTREEERW